jgi:hypothetical protein
MFLMQGLKDKPKEESSEMSMMQGLKDKIKEESIRNVHDAGSQGQTKGRENPKCP